MRFSTARQTRAINGIPPTISTTSLIPTLQASAHQGAPTMTLNIVLTARVMTTA
jgi:hypothetical protein